jgi:dipeptidyl aminopeptidase/acylaminoacyl peptidase
MTKMNKKLGIGISVCIVVVAIVAVAMFTGCIAEKTATLADQTTVSLEGDPQADHTFWTVNDTMRVAQIESMDVSLDGKKVTYAVKRAVMTEEESKWHYQIYIVDSDGNNVFQLTQGEASSYHPKWSPDGQFIAFLSDRSGKTDIWMIPVSGGESVLLTDVKTGVANFRWSPDGEMISFLTSDPVSYEVERAVAAKDDAMVVDQDIYATGGLVSINHLWTVSTEKNSTGQYGMRRLTEGNFSVFDWDWSPDGNAIVFSHASGFTLDDLLYSDISELDVETGDIKSLVGVEANNEYGPLYSPDGQWIVYCSTTAGSLIEEVKVYLLPVGGGNLQPLAEMPGLFVESSLTTGWSKDSDLIYFLVGNRTKAEIVALPTNGSAPRQVFEWDLISHLNLNDAGTMFGFTLEGTSTPPEAYVSEVDDFRPVQISNINQDLPLNLLGKTEVVVWNSSDGLEIEGLLTYPANYEAGEKYPLLLEVHGGPTGAYYQSFIGTNIFMNSQAPYSSQGYAVLRCNPRGSTGYGIEFMKGNFPEWGGMDYQDLMTGVDHIVEMGVADPERLGVMGWSYGGYMTAWIITHTDRFKAASVGAGPVDLVSYVGTMDSPNAISSYFGCRFWEDYGLYLSRSPIYHVKNVTTPTLIQHGAEDVRVPLTQGEELYSALKKRGIPVKMVVYPRSGHHIDEPKLYRACLEDRLEWFNKYIPATNE